MSGSARRSEVKRPTSSVEPCGTSCSGGPVIDLDIACPTPAKAARSYAGLAGGAVFPLSDRHGAWRVAFRDGRTVDFTPLPDGIEADLGTRDFTINAIAIPLAGGEPVDPFGGRGDLEARGSPGGFATDLRGRSDSPPARRQARRRARSAPR